MPSDFITKPPYNVIQPGAYSAVNASQIAQPSFGANRPIPAIVGAALGGQPDVALYFHNPGQLQQVLRGGPGYDLARFTFDGGAAQVCFVRVGNSVTQASKALSGTGTVLTLTARDWGSWANAIKVTVATGPIITLSYTDALGNVFTEKWDLTAVASPTPALFAQAINGTLAGYSASNFVTAAAGAGTLPLTNVSASAFTGGTDGLAPAAGDWTAGLSALETEAVDFVVPATGDATVHAQVQVHCQNMSAPAARKERVAAVGAVLGESVAQQTVRMANLPSGRVQLVYPGFNDFDQNGNLVLWDPFYLAGKIAGMHCAQPDPASSLVHQLVPIISAEVDLSTMQGGAIDQLLAANVTPVARANGGGYWVVDSLTGYTQPDQTFHDMTKTRSADFVAQYARYELETQYVGSKGLTSSQAAIAASGNDVLTKLQTMQIIRAFEAVTVQPGPKIGSWNVTLPVMLIDTNKFIFITVMLQPSSTAASSTTVQDALA